MYGIKGADKPFLSHKILENIKIVILWDIEYILYIICNLNANVEKKKLNYSKNVL